MGACLRLPRSWCSCLWVVVVQVLASGLPLLALQVMQMHMRVLVLLLLLLWVPWHASVGRGAQGVGQSGGNGGGVEVEGWQVRVTPLYARENGCHISTGCERMVCTQRAMTAWLIGHWAPYSNALRNPEGAGVFYVTVEPPVSLPKRRVPLRSIARTHAKTYKTENFLV